MLSGLTPLQNPTPKRIVCPA